MGESEFHFSPRPNRAHEIKWRGWSDEAFAEASKLDRPILLSISAVWCHWCHVMDETTYSNSGVIDLINREYVPIRVDNDVRPDINQRYNMGGWPTTAFLTSSGDILTGATYLPTRRTVRRSPTGCWKDGSAPARAWHAARGRSRTESSMRSSRR